METQQQYDNQEEVEIDERSLKCNAFIIEYILYKKVDYLVEDLLRELPYDRDNVNLRTRLIISQLNGLWEEVEQEDKVDGDRIGFIVSSVTALLGLLDERKQTFAEFFQEATFSADAYSKKIKKWLTSFINADTYELKYQSLEALVKYFNILGNYLGEPKLYSLLNQPKQIQEETQSNDAVMNEPQIPQITVDSLPDEPCTYLGLKNTGISTSEETTIFITERLFNARKPSKPIPQVPEKAPRQEELTQQPTQQVVAASTQSNQDEQAKKRKPTANANNLKKKRLMDSQKDAKRVVIIREFASSEDDEDIPITRASKLQRPRSKSDTNGKSKKKSVFEDSSSSEEETERVLFKPRKKSKDTKQKKVFWTDDEVNALLKGFKMYGTQWARILAEFKKTFHPNRDSLSLRDKYRNMEKYGQI